MYQVTLVTVNLVCLVFLAVSVRRVMPDDQDVMVTRANEAIKVILEAGARTAGPASRVTREREDMMASPVKLALKAWQANEATQVNLALMDHPDHRDLLALQEDQDKTGRLVM